MGIVYRARDTAINADVALKTLADTADPMALRMFREECEKLAKITHPNVVEIRDVGEIEEGGVRKACLVMPFLRGKTLDFLLLDSPGGLPVDRALEILVQASRGLQATHDAGLIHRDIKPSNIFVLEDDSVKLIDFGVAHYAENLLTATRKGTLMYMAPEQVQMEGISPLSDIFSLGVVAYETLTGRRPFESRTEKELIDSILHRNPPPASTWNSQLNSAVDQTLQKALAKLPEHRFQSARELGETLRKAILNQRIAMFDPARIAPRIEQARGALAHGDVDSADGILNRLESEGWLDNRILELRRDLERLRNQRAVSSLLASARLRMEAREYEQAAEEIEEALRLDRDHSQAAALRRELEHRRAEWQLAERLTEARGLADARDFSAAKESIEQALENSPNEAAAVELRANIQQREQEYRAAVNEKHRATRQAEQALAHGDGATALDAIQRARDLDREAPEQEEVASSLLNLSNRIASVTADAQKSLERARDLYESGDLAAALACCDEGLARLPEHTLLRSLRLDVEDAQRERGANLRRREFADAVAAKARAAEEEHRAAACRSRDDLLHQIRSATEAGEFAGALHLIRKAPELESDPVFDNLRGVAEEGVKRERVAGDLLVAAAALEKQERYVEALEKLNEASALGVRKREIAAARQRFSAQQEHSVLETDSRVSERALAETAGASKLGAVRQRISGSLSALHQESGGGNVAFAEKTPSNPGTPLTPAPETRTQLFGFRRMPRVKGAVIGLVGSAVVAAILLALMIPRRATRVAVPRQPAVVVQQRPAGPVNVPVHVEPADAELTVDGSPATAGDGELTLDPGTHVIEAHAPGFTSFSQTVNVPGSDNIPLNIALVPIPAPAVVHVETDLQFGSVLMDGKRAGALDDGQFSQEVKEGSHTLMVLPPKGGRYLFAFTLDQDTSWTVQAAKSTAYGTPVSIALSSTGTQIVCGRPGLAFTLDSGQPAACTAAGNNVPAMSRGEHTLTLLDGSRTVAVHTLDYEGSPVLNALITTGAQFGGLAIQGTEDAFDVSVNGYTSKRPAKAGHWRRLLKPGDYTLVISKPSFRASPSTLNVSVVPGVDTLEQVSFAPELAHARLRLQSQAGTEVTLNGKSAGTVPASGVLELAQLPTGSAELRLHRKGFADVQQSVTLADGENQRSIFLQELKARISWNVDPPGAQISYSTAGSSVRHPLTGNNIELSSGTYDFEASAPGRAPANLVVTVAAGETKNMSLRLEAEVASPMPPKAEVWPGWAQRNGWLMRDKPGPIFQSLPEHTSRVAFSAQWERPKSIVHWSAGSLNVAFRSADAARGVIFRITEHGIAWNVIGRNEHQEGRFPLNIQNNSETIQADIRPTGVALTINGSPLAAVGPNLASESGPLQFGFIIQQDQIVRLSNIHVGAESTAK